MLPRSHQWREAAWLRKVRIAAAREADTAYDAAQRCGGRWPAGRVGKVGVHYHFTFVS